MRTTYYVYKNSFKKVKLRETDILADSIKQQSKLLASRTKILLVGHAVSSPQHQPGEGKHTAWARNIQLFRERSSEKVHATILKGIVGGFEFTVLPRNLKELARKAMKMCLRVLKESNKSRFDSYSRQEQCIDHIPYYLLGLSRAHFSNNLSRNSCIPLLKATENGN